MFYTYSSYVLFVYNHILFSLLCTVCVRGRMARGLNCLQMCRCGFSCWYYLANESLCLHTFLEAFHAKSNINNDKAEVSFKHILCVQGLWHMHALHSIHPLFIAACYMHFILQCPGVPHVFKNHSNAPGALSFVLLLAGLALFTKYAKGLAESGKTQKEGHTTSPRTSRFT